MRRIPFVALPLLAGALLASRSVTLWQEPRFTVPEGFAVETVYAPERSGSVVALTFDSKGRMVIAREFAQIFTLFDNNGDGVMDEERPFTDQVTTSQGIFFDGPDLLVVGRGVQGVGLYRASDDDGDSRADRVELVEKAVASIGDHGPHAVFFGPDGYLYWDQGNGTGIFDRYSPLSPLREYDEASVNGRCDPRGHACTWRAPGGIFLRTAYTPRGVTGERAPLPANTEWELFAGGFRNQYDGAFNLIGELFTLDSDMEWDRDLPWYKGTSTVHVLPGGDHAWRSGSMNHPWHYLDNLPPLEDHGRGSPTGVAVLQTYNYPREYWDMLVLADWSRGRVIGGRLARNGASYTQRSSNFIYGEPLNVTDLEVGPDGNLYFTLGGRSTQGGVYRLAYRGQNAMAKPEARTPLDRVLTMIQPRSAFSRELARTTRDQLGRSWERGLDRELRDTRATAERRVRAMELLHVFGPELDEELLRGLRGDPSWEVRAASTYYLGLHRTPTAQAELVARLKDADPFVQRRAAEALIRTGVHPVLDPPFSPVADVLPLLSSPDRFVRYQARALLRQTRPHLWEDAALAVEGYPQAPEALMAVVETVEDPRVTEVTRLLGRELELLRANPSEAELLQLIRVIQRTMLEDVGVVNHNLTALVAPPLVPGQPTPAPVPGGGGGQQQQAVNAYAEIGRILLERFPARDTLLSREIARTVAYLETPGAVAKISAELANPALSRTQGIFYADQLSYMENGWDDASIERLTAWLERPYREGWRGGASYMGYINYIRDAFLNAIPAAKHAAVSERIQAAQPQLAVAPTQGVGQQQAVALADEELFEELVFNPNVTQGSAAGGVAAYQKALCIACHTFGPIGTEFGPDLTTINQRFTRRDLVRAVTHPSETVSDLWQVEEITRRNGQKVAGTIYREDGTQVIVQIPGTQTQITIPKSDIQARVRSERSPMPHGLLNPLNSQERRNLFLLLEAGPAAIPDSALARLGVTR